MQSGQLTAVLIVAIIVLGTIISRPIEMPGTRSSPCISDRAVTLVIVAGVLVVSWNMVMVPFRQWRNRRRHLRYGPKIDEDLHSEEFSDEHARFDEFADFH